MTLKERIQQRDANHMFIAPSLLASNLAHVADEVKAMEMAGVDMLHVDVMDGHFVPNLSFGVPFIKMLKGITDLPLDVHLMIDNADDTLDWYLDAGADGITIHGEASTHMHRTIQRINDAGVASSVSLNPASPVSLIEEVLPCVDMVLLMSVNPGFGGQAYISAVTQKAHRLMKKCAKRDCAPLIQIDGGINATTIKEVASAGCRCFVAGSAIFNSDDPQKAVIDLRNAAAQNA